MIRLLLLHWRRRQLRYAIDTIRGSLAEAEAAEAHYQAELQRVDAAIAAQRLNIKYRVMP